MSLHPPIAPTIPPPLEGARSRIGVVLRRAREERRQSIPDVAAALRIRAEYLEAIEAGTYERLPGQTYTVGFVRSYANYLGLDAEDAVRVFKREGQGFDPAPASLAMPTPLPQRSIPGGRVLVMGLVLAICGYGLWSYLGGRQGGETVAPVPASLGGNPTPSEAQAAVRDPSGPPSAGPKTATPQQTTIGAQAAAPPAAAVRPVPVASTAEPAPTPSSAPQKLALAGAGAPQPAPAQPPAPAPQPGHVFGVTDGPARIELRFTADCWVQVRGPGSDLASGKLMHAGDVYRVPDHPDLTIRVGNTGAMAIAVDGKPVTLPKGHSLVQTIALDPTRLAAGTAEVNSHHGGNNDDVASQHASQHTGGDQNAAPRPSTRVDRAAAAAATADAARNAPAFIDDLPRRRPHPAAAMRPVGPPPGALDTPPPPPNQPPPPDTDD